MNPKKPESRPRHGAFLLYVDDWLSSTAIDLMTAAEERGYLRLLMHAWKAEDCGLPDDDSVLAVLSKLGGAWKGKSGAVLRAQFTPRDGRLFNERLLRERTYQEEQRRKRSKAGEIANEARWGPKEVDGMLQAMHQACMTHSKTMQTHPASIGGAGPHCENQDPNSQPPESGEVPSVGRNDLASNVDPMRMRSGSHADGNSNSNSNLDNTDLDYEATNHKNRDSSPRLNCSEFPNRQYPTLTGALFAYMGKTPSARTVTDVMHAGNGSTEAQVVACLKFLYEDRGLRPGTQYGPRCWAWFKRVVSNHFMETAPLACPAKPDQGLSQAEFGRMTDAISGDGGTA